MRPARAGRGVVVLLAAALSACTGGGAEGTGSEGGGSMADRQSITDVHEAHAQGWMEVPGVVGTGIGRCGDDPCIKVFVSERTTPVEERIPGEVEGYTVRVEVTGSFRTRRDTGGG